MDRVRVIRVLEYVGTREWVEETLAQPHAIKGTATFNNGTCYIREAFLGDFPEIVEEEKKLPYQRPYIDEKEWRFMERFGWELHKTPATKHDPITGKVLAHEGDETWDRDLKVAGE